MQKLIDKLKFKELEYFGCSISICDSGDTVVVGARGGSPTEPVTAGSAYVFTDGNVQKLTAYDGKFGDRFGVCCKISGDGTTIAIGSYQSHSVYVFKKKEEFEFEYKLLPGETSKFFGYNLDISHTGDKIMVGAFNYNNRHGKAYFFKNDILLDSLQPDETKEDHFFGRSVCFNDDASECYIGATGASTVYKYKWYNDSWVETERIRGDNNSSFGNSISYDNKNLVIGAFKNDGYILLNDVKIKGKKQYGGCVKARHGYYAAGAFANTDEWFGYSIDIFPDGSALVGSPRGNKITHVSVENVLINKIPV